MYDISYGTEYVRHMCGLWMCATSTCTVTRYKETSEPNSHFKTSSSNQSLISGTAATPAHLSLTIVQRFIEQDGKEGNP